MTSFSQGNRISHEAAADLSAKQFHVVKTDSNGKVVLASGATDKVLGVLANAPILGDTADVHGINANGTFKVKAGGTIAKDAYLTANADGEAIATTTTGNVVFGRAVRAAVDTDLVEYIPLYLIHP